MIRASCNLWRRRSGFVSLAVMIIVVLITYACYEFTFSAVDEHRAAAAAGDRMRLELCADSAEQLLLLDLQSTTRSDGTEETADGTQRSFEDPAIERYAGRPVGGFPQSERRPQFTIVSSVIDSSGELRLQYGSSDESARLSLAAVAQWERAQPGQGVAALTKLPGIDPLKASATAAYLLGVSPQTLEADSVERRPAIAQSSETRSRGTTPWLMSRSIERRARRQPRDETVVADLAPTTTMPTASATGAVSAAETLPPTWQGATIEELTSVVGIGTATLHGGDLNANYFVSPWETEYADRLRSNQRLGGGPGKSLADRPDLASSWGALLTAYSAERNVNRRGEPRIYLNDSDLGRLRELLNARLPARWAEFIMTYRSYGDAGQARAIASVYDLIGAQATAPGGDGQMQSIESPFSADRSSYSDYLLQLSDELTTDARTVIPGRININLAPRAVLRAIPGVDEQLVDRIMAGRERAASDTRAARYHAAWLASEGWIEIAWLRQLEPYITAGGHVRRAQVISYFAQGSDARADAPMNSEPMFVRREVIVDGARQRPCIALRRDLGSLGRGFREEALKP
ncbi:MAG: hypothetical protein KDA61_08730 [Planctomycetales bacterium]|nr:hypothetical protein [Planctomycetales bacterium]